MKIEVVNDDTYQQFRKTTPAVLVVTAPWCGFCYYYQPQVESLADRLPNVRFGRVTEEEREIRRWWPFPKKRLGYVFPQKFMKKLSNQIRDDKGVMHFPTTIIFRKPDDLIFFSGNYKCDDAHEIVTTVLNSDSVPETYLARLHKVNPKSNFRPGNYIGKIVARIFAR